MLDGKQRQQAEVRNSPREEAVGFRGPSGTFPGIPVAQLSADQKALVQKTLQKLLEMTGSAEAACEVLRLVEAGMVRVSSARTGVSDRFGHPLGGCENPGCCPRSVRNNRPLEIAAPGEAPANRDTPVAGGNRGRAAFDRECRR